MLHQQSLACRELGHFTWAGVPIKRHLAEFRITEDAYLPVGTVLNAAHFVPGQFVDVQGELFSQQRTTLQPRLSCMTGKSVLLACLGLRSYLVHRLKHGGTDGRPAFSFE